jgi:hypothetical protein
MMMSICGLSAMGQPNLAGVWEATAPQHVLLRIDQQDASFDITIRSNGLDQSFHAAVGRRTENSIQGLPVKAEAKWDGATLQLNMSAAPQGKELRVTLRYTLSADGNWLQHEETHQLDTQPAATHTIVFSRLPAAAWVKDPPPTPAEAVYKNIQIMKGVPVPKLHEAMRNLTRWLGVECAHCHVDGHFESDEKPAKQTARTMFSMVRALNKESFPATNAVTCWTCHRGSAKPESLPAK